jgi:translocation and assembly module TamA
VLFRVDAGRTYTPAFRSLPPSIRFFAGGDQSVRGYDYQSLGPADVAGNVVGGTTLLTGGAEIEQRFLERWGVAAFIDAGKAFASGDFSLEEGVGAGIRWLSPVGLVRLDLAAAVSEPGNPLRIHVVIGPDL